MAFRGPHAGSRKLGTNPRALGLNQRKLARNKWALRNWKRSQQKLETPARKRPE